MMLKVGGMQGLSLSLYLIILMFVIVIIVILMVTIIIIMDHNMVTIMLLKVGGMRGLTPASNSSSSPPPTFAPSAPLLEVIVSIPILILIVKLVLNQWQQAGR